MENSVQVKMEETQRMPEPRKPELKLQLKPWSSEMNQMILRSSHKNSKANIKKPSIDVAVVVVI